MPGLHLVTPWQLSMHCHLMDGVRPLRLMWSPRWLGMFLGPTQRDSGVPSLGLGCRFLSFLGSVDMLHFVSRLLGLSLYSAKEPLFPY